MKKFNKNLVNKKLFKFIKSYSNDKHALSALLKKKNTMQTLKVNNIKSLKFFNIAYLSNKDKIFFFKHLKKNIIFNNLKFFFFYDILNFLRFNLSLVFDKNNLLKSSKYSFEFLRNTYISYFFKSFDEIYNIFLSKILLKKKKNL